MSVSNLLLLRNIEGNYRRVMTIEPQFSALQARLSTDFKGWELI
jgi:hypothetical protein